MSSLLPPLRLLLLLCCLATSTLAQNTTTEIEQEPIPYDTKFTPSIGFLGAIGTLTGVYILGFGYRYFRPTTFLAGAYIFGIAAYITLANSEDLKNPYPVGAELAASLVVGLVGGTTTCWLWRVGTCVVSVLGGFFVGAWILGWRSGGLTQEEVGQVAILVIPMVILGILLFFFETNIILFSTSFTGAYTLLWSIDRLILHTSFSLGVRVFLNRNGPQPWYTVDWRVYALLGGVALVALLGTIAQGRVWVAQRGQMLFRDVAGEVEDGNGDMPPKEPANRNAGTVELIHTQTQQRRRGPGIV